MSPIGDGAVEVDAIVITLLRSSTVISFGACDIPYQMLSRASLGILSELFDAFVMISHRKDCLCSCGQIKCSANASVTLSCIWIESVVIIPSGSSSECVVEVLVLSCY